MIMKTKRFIFYVIFTSMIFMMFTIFTSCSTVQTFINDISSTVSTAIGSRSGNSNISEGIKAKATPITLKPLPVPVSYETAYSYRTNQPESLASSIKKNKTFEDLRKSNPQNYVRSVVAEINKTATNDFEKVKLAHDITALLISYDAASFWSGNLPPQDYFTVLKTGKSVCEGYANVFLEFCNQLKIECKKVSGYARGVGFNLLTEQANIESNHAWNMVKIDENWYLVDCTWDSGYMNGKVSKQEYKTDWLFTKPEHFINSHFPDNARYQLISPELSTAELFSLPSLDPVFYDVVSEYSDLSKINKTDSSFVLNYVENPGYSLSFSVKNAKTNSAVKNGASVQRNTIENSDKKTVTVTFKTSTTGNYIVDIFCFKDGSRTGWSCGQFIVEKL